MELDTVLACRSTWVLSGLLVPTVRRVVVLRGKHGGQGGPRCSGSVELPWRSELTEAARRAIPGNAEGLGRDWCLGDAPGVVARLLRGSSGAGMRRSGVATGAQGCGAADRGEVAL